MRVLQVPTIARGIWQIDLRRFYVVLEVFSTAGDLAKVLRLVEQAGNFIQLHVVEGLSSECHKS